MNFFVVQRILGLLLVVFSFTLLPPVAISMYFNDGNAMPFIESFGILLLVGLAIWWPTRKHIRELRLRDGFLVVASFWVVLGIAAATPLILSDRLNMSITDAVFEAVSGFTTTGATVLTGLDQLPRSILFYRQQIQWLGGIGMVILAVAVLPMLGVGGMQLLKSGAPGSTKDSRLTPRITETARALWFVYVGITAVCACSYWLTGMGWFDAVAHAFSTVSTGGFSTHDQSLAHFNNAGIESVAIVFMLIGGINFSLHFVVWRRWQVIDYFRDPECRAYFALLLVIAVICTVSLIAAHTFKASEAIRHGVLQSVSFITSTGFTTTNFAVWPGALPVLLILSTFIGGCAGSTASGMKVIRWLLMWKQGACEISRLVHPSAVLPVKLGNKAIDSRVIDSVWGFFAFYVVSFGVLMVALMSTGEDQVTAFSAIATCINNTGPALGHVAGNFVQMGDSGKWLCILAMLLGRLEIYPLLILVAPAFWRR
jgi:trk system potassium uptake protein